MMPCAGQRGSRCALPHTRHKRLSIQPAPRETLSISSTSDCRILPRKPTGRICCRLRLSSCGPRASGVEVMWLFPADEQVATEVGGEARESLGVAKRAVLGAYVGGSTWSPPHTIDEACRAGGPLHAAKSCCLRHFDGIQPVEEAVLGIFRPRDESNVVALVAWQLQAIDTTFHVAAEGVHVVEATRQRIEFGVRSRLEAQRRRRHAETHRFEC